VDGGVGGIEEEVCVDKEDDDDDDDEEKEEEEGFECFGFLSFVEIETISPGRRVSLSTKDQAKKKKKYKNK
jgi:hypothetical protein